jgi:hypothetical protein
LRTDLGITVISGKKFFDVRNVPAWYSWQKFTLGNFVCACLRACVHTCVCVSVCLSVSVSWERVGEEEESSSNIP